MAMYCAGDAEARVPKKARRYAPKLTASSSKYFTRGQGDKPSETDVVVYGRRRIHLQPYDKLLKKFECALSLIVSCVQRFVLGWF